MVLDSIGDFSAVISLVALVITWCIIQPLKQAIAGLTKSMDKLTQAIDVTKAEVNELRERMAKVEASTTSAHKRLDDYLK